MPLPKQLQRQADEADAKLKELEDAQTRDALASPIAPPESAPQDQPPPSVEPVPAAPIPAQDGDIAKRLEDLNHKYSVLSGKYNAEVKPVNELKKRIEELELIVDFQKKQLDQIPEAPAPQADPGQIQLNLSEEDKEKYGEEYLATVGKIGAQAAQEVIKKQVEAKLKHLEEVARKTEFDRFVDDVCRHVPDFKDVDKSDEFNAWLQKTQDGFSGSSLMDSIVRAGQRRDVATVVKIVQEFKRLKGGGQQALTGTLSRPDIEASIAPIASSSSPVSGNTKPRYTLAQFRKTYDAIAKGGLYSPAQARQIMAELDLALAEGRVQG